MTTVNITNPVINVDIGTGGDLAVDIGGERSSYSIDTKAAIYLNKTLPMIVSETTPVSQVNKFWYNLLDDTLNIQNTSTTWKEVPYTVPVVATIVNYTIPLSGTQFTIALSDYNIANLIRYSVILNSTLEVVEPVITHINSSLVIDSNVELTGHSLVLVGN